MQKHFLRFFLVVILIIFSNLLFCQEIPIGTWRDHLSYSNAVSVTEGNGVVYCASESAVFSYNTVDHGLERMNLISGLSDIGVKSLKYNTINNKLLIAYENGNLDIIRPDKQVVNLSFIKNSNIIADKTINEIYLFGSKAYLSTGFGIVVIDMDKEEVIDTYYIGSLGVYLKTNSVTIDNQYIYAATQEGVYYADKNSTNLADYNNWSLMSDLGSGSYSRIVNFNGNLIVGQDNPSYSSDSVFYNNSGVWEKLISQGVQLNNIEVSSGKTIICSDASIKIFDGAFNEVNSFYTFQNEFTIIPNSALIINNEVWVADENNGLIHYFSGGWSGEIIAPNGPNTSSVFKMDLVDNSLWITSGGYATYRSLFPYNYRVNGSWNKAKSKLYNPENQSILSDLISVAIDPNDKNHIYLGSWSEGLIEMYNNEVQKVYNGRNSPLDSVFFGITSVGTLLFDKDNNLWITSSYTSDILSIKMPNNNWFSYSFPGETKSDGYYTKMIVDNNDFLWFLERKYNVIMVFDPNKTYEDTSDDRLYTGLNFGTATIYTFEKDKNGEIWFGTSQGVGVLSNPNQIFTESVVINPIYIQQDGQTQLLLESENVTAIAIDGANRKWFGTQNSGVYLMNEDGTEEIEHFTTENSPLFSNNIYDIKIEGKTGEVYIATERGLISYKGTATESNDDFENIFVYPNPVKPDYNGVIAVRGLTYDTDVRITDISGNIVFQTKSLGGQAIWDGNDLNGQRVQTGVYMVFCATQDGGLKNAAKILFIN